MGLFYGRFMIDMTTIGIALDTSGLERGTRALNDTERAANRTADAADHTGRQFKSLSSAVDMAKNAMAAYLSLQTVKVFVQTADAIALMDARLKLATKSTTEFVQAQKDVFSIAKRNSTGLQETATLYTKLADPVRQFGGSARETAGIVDAFTKTLKISGASSEEAASSTLQFAQAMASGRLQGDEFRAMAETSPRFMKAMAEGLGIPTSKLKEMGAEGRITADVVGNALLESLGKLTEEAKTLPDTVGNSFTRLKNEVQIAVDTINKQSGMTLGLTDVIDTAAKLIPAIRDELAGAFQSVGVWINGNREKLGEVWETAKGLMSDVWEIAKAAGSVLGFLAQWALQSDGVNTILQTGRLLLAGFQDGVEFIGAAFATVGSIIFKVVLTPLRWYLDGIAKVQGFLGNADSSNAYAAAAASIKDFADAGSKYGDAVVAKFARGESAVAKLQAEMGKAKTATTEAGKAAEDASGQYKKLTAASDAGAKAAEAAKKSAQAYDHLMKSISEKTAADQLDMQTQGDMTAGQREAVKIMDDLRTGVLKLNEAQKIKLTASLESRLAIEQEKLGIEAQTKALAELRAEEKKRVAAMESLSAGMTEANAAMREEIELIGLTDAAQLIVLQQRNDAIILTKQATLAELERRDAITGTMTREQIALASEIESLKERNGLLGQKYDRTAVAKAADEAAAEWKKATEQINQSLTDALMRGFESGKDFAKNMRDTIVNMFKTLVLRPIISAVVNPVAGAVTGMMGMAGAANAGQSALGMAGSASSLFSAGSSLGGLGAVGGAMSGFATAATASMQSLVGMSGTVAQMTTSLAAAGHSAAAGVSAGVQAFQAIPGWGWAIAGIALLGAALSKPKTLHSGAGAIYSEAGGMQGGADIYNRATFGMGAESEWNTQSQDAVSGLAKGFTQVMDGVAVAFGKKAGYEIATAFADDTSKDGAWGSLRISKDGKDIANWEDTRSSKWAPKEFANGEEGLKQYLAAVAVEVRDTLKSSTPAWADAMLDGLGEAPSIEQLAGVVEQLKSIQAVFAGFGQYMPTFTGLAESAVDKLVAASGGVQALTGNMSAFVDNFYTDAEKLAVNTDNVRAAMEKLGFELPTTRDEFKALLQSQMALGDAGAENSAILLGLSGAVASIIPSAAAATDSIKAMTESLDDYIGSSVRNAAEARYLRGLEMVGNTAALKRLGVPGYASGGYHSGGLRLVGENGPELEVTGPANIISSPVTSALLSGRGGDGATVAELKGLRGELQSEIKNLRAEVRAVVVQTAKAADIWERVTPGRNSISIATPYGPVQVATPAGKPLSVDQVT